MSEPGQSSRIPIGTPTPTKENVSTALPVLVTRTTNSPAVPRPIVTLPGMAWATTPRECVSTVGAIGVPWIFRDPPTMPVVGPETA